jgi:hypothetical protein
VPLTSEKTIVVEGNSVSMKKDWVAAGALELAGGMLAVLMGQVVLRTGGFHVLLVGLGSMFIMIGAIVFLAGARGGRTNYRYCMICGRPVGPGRMYCQKCDP